MKKLNYNYIKENYGNFMKLLYYTLDRKPVKNQKNRDEFKFNILLDYINFLYNLNFLSIQKDNVLWNQQQYCNKLFILCDRAKSESLEEVISDEMVEPFCDILLENVKDWLRRELDTELYNQEKSFYTSLAFDKESSAQSQFKDRLNQLKNHTEEKMSW